MGFWDRMRRRSRSDESGAVTVEFVLWVPFLFSFLVLIVNASALMHVQTLMFDAARDAARQVATGVATSDEAKTTAVARFNTDYAMTASATQEDNFVTVTLEAPFANLVYVGGAFVSALVGDRDLTASVTMLMEQDDAS